MVTNEYVEGTRKLEEFDMLEELSKDKEYDVRIGDDEELIITIVEFKKGKGKKTWKHTPYVLCQCYAHYKIIIKEDKKIIEHIPYTINQLLQLSKNYCAPQVYAFLVTNKLINEYEINLSIKKISNTNYLIRLLTKEEIETIAESVSLHRHSRTLHSSTVHSIVRAVHSSKDFRVKNDAITEQFGSSLGAVNNQELTKIDEEEVKD